MLTAEAVETAIRTYDEAEQKAAAFDWSGGQQVARTPVDVDTLVSTLDKVNVPALGPLGDFARSVANGDVARGALWDGVASRLQDAIAILTRATLLDDGPRTTFVQDDGGEPDDGQPRPRYFPGLGFTINGRHPERVHFLHAVLYAQRQVYYAIGSPRTDPDRLASGLQAEADTLRDGIVREMIRLAQRNLILPLMLNILTGINYYDSSMNETTVLQAIGAYLTARANPGTAMQSFNRSTWFMGGVRVVFGIYDLLDGQIAPDDRGGGWESSIETIVDAEMQRLIAAAPQDYDTQLETIQQLNTIAASLQSSPYPAHDTQVIFYHHEGELYAFVQTTDGSGDGITVHYDGPITLEAARILESTTNSSDRPPGEVNPYFH